jgi:signal peptide peptidase SppA
MDKTRTAKRRDGVAIVPVNGPISRYAGMFEEMCGGTSVETFAKDFHAAIDDPMCKAVMLDIDSPGGQASGIGELANMIRQGSAKKPVCAYVGSMACSAAYYLASAAPEIVAHESATLGSIGVISQVDARTKPGVYTIVSSQSPLKDAMPDSESGRNEWQSWVDALADVFVKDVADYRGVSAEKVLAEFGCGGVKVGKAALDAGMIDSLGDYESTLARLCSTPSKPGGYASAPTPKGVKTMKDADDVAVLAEAADHEHDAPKFEIVTEIRNKAAHDAEVAVRKEMAGFYAEQAKAWVMSMIRAEKATPAESGKLAAAYVAFALDDRNGHISFADGAKQGTASRLGLLTSLVGDRGASRFMSEVIPSADSGAPVPLSLDGATVLPEAGVSEGERTNKIRPDVLAKCLQSTPLGRAVLADKK